jgi:glycosyltransferase involved in cell wall biosynthesis
MLNSNKISAVVRTWNSDKTLAITLQSLKIQSPMIDEIIVVDSGSSDTTLQIAEKFGCCIIHYPKEPFNYSKALNLGIRKAAGPRVLIISSHTVLAYKNIVELMSLQLDRFFAAGVYCTVLSKPFDLPRQADPVRGQLIDMIHEDNFNGNNGLGNPCSLIERACWEIHHFDETLPAAEDIEWALWHYRNTKRFKVEKCSRPRHNCQLHIPVV